MNENTKKRVAFPDPEDLSFDQVVKESWQLVASNMKPLLGLVFVPFIPAFIAVILLFALMVSLNGEFLTSPPGVLVTVSFFVLLLPAIYVSLRAQVGIFYLLSQALLNNKIMTFREGWDGAVGLIWPTIVMSLLVGLVTLLGFILLIIPGFIALLYLSLAQVAVIDGKRGLNSLRKSRDLVKKQPFLVLASLGGVFILVMIISYVPVIGIVASILGQMLVSAITVYLYYVLKQPSKAVIEAK